MDIIMHKIIISIKSLLKRAIAGNQLPFFTEPDSVSRLIIKVTVPMMLNHTQTHAKSEYSDNPGQIHGLASIHCSVLKVRT